MEESAIIYFWVISNVKLELVSDILETVSISGIGVLCDENKASQRLHNQTVPSGYRDSGAKCKVTLSFLIIDQLDALISQKFILE